ncbi:hypothetical protein LCGC14_2459930, partial [marine sediment metagenome]
GVGRWYVYHHHFEGGPMVGEDRVGTLAEAQQIALLELHR